jgi:uncharacterized protein
MRKLTATLCLTITVLLGSVGMSWGVDYLKGFAAYGSGDYATALREWKPLAEQGDAIAQYLVGVMYDEGQGVPQNYWTALKWYTLAAEQGNTVAQHKMGVMYDEGKGVPQDYKTAVKWYKLAAEQGNADAQGNLAVMYAFGRGVLKDYVYAHMWANIAVSIGGKDKGKVRDFVEKKMTPSQIAEAQRFARECVRKNYIGC